MVAISTGTALAMMAIGTGVSALGSIQAGNAANAQAKFQAQVQRQQAERERQVAAADEADFRRQQSRQMASRRAILGGSGVDLSSGSPLLASEDFASEIELQALRIRNSGDVSATRLDQQASLTRAAGRQARTAGYFRAGSSLLSGFGKVGYFGEQARAGATG